MVILEIVSLVVIVYIILNICYKMTNHNKNFFENSNKFARVPRQLDVVCTGSSYAKFDIDFAGTGIRGFNFGVFPQSLHYDYKILQQYKKHLNKGCKVLITLSPLVFGFLDYQEDQANYKYYKFLKPRYIENYSLLTHICHIWFPLIATPRLARYIFKDVPPRDLYQCGFVSREVCEQEACQRAEGWCVQFGMADLEHSQVSPNIEKEFGKVVSVLDQMIDFCVERDWEPVLVIPPVSRCLKEKMSDEFLQAYLYENIDKANKRGIKVLDYLQDGQLQRPEYYFNADFMNSMGRKVFTRGLLQTLGMI